MLRPSRILFLLIFLGLSVFVSCSGNKSKAKYVSGRFGEGPWLADTLPIPNSKAFLKWKKKCGISPIVFQKLATAAKIDSFPIHAWDEDGFLVLLRKSAKDPIRHLILQPNPFGYLYVDLDTSHPLQTDIVRLPHTIVPRMQGGYVLGGSLRQTLNALQLPPDMTRRLADAFDWSVDFFDLGPGDFVKVMTEEVEVQGKSVRTHRLIGAQIDKDGKSYFAFEWRKGNKLEYLNEKGENLKKSFLRSPLDYAQISSGFSYSRFHPILHRFRPHLGIDYVAPLNSPIRSIADGTIEEAGVKGGNGLFVRIQHGHGHETGYLHLNSLASGIFPGTRVQQGQVIGYLGSTGLSTGPHLCFRYWFQGEPANPDLIQSRTDVIQVLPEPELSQYLEATRVNKNRLAEFTLPLPGEKEITF